MHDPIMVSVSSSFRSSTIPYRHYPPKVARAAPQTLDLSISRSPVKLFPIVYLPLRRPLPTNHAIILRTSKPTAVPHERALLIAADPFAADAAIVLLRA